jgi:hypothetical protein
MNKIFTEKEFNLAKSMDELKLKCYHCDKIFFKYKKEIKTILKRGIDKGKYCSVECRNNSRKNRTNVNCDNCNLVFEKKVTQITKSKSGKNFCSKSCAVTFNNKNKTYGTRRSKLESWIEERLIELYPNIEFHFNQKTAINSELDIYIPSLNIAFELNGIFHYEPIYGVDKFNQIKENDISKTKLCHEAKIDLCIIDTSSQINFKESTSKKFLEIIVKIINQRIND